MCDLNRGHSQASTWGSVCGDALVFMLREMWVGDKGKWVTAREKGGLQGASVLEAAGKGGAVSEAACKRKCSSLASILGLSQIANQLKENFCDS